MFSRGCGLPLVDGLWPSLARGAHGPSGLLGRGLQSFQAALASLSSGAPHASARLLRNHLVQKRGVIVVLARF